MAETGRLRAMEAFWSRDESDVDSSLVHVPGVSEAGNRRPSRPVRVKGRRTQEVKTSVPVSRRPVSEAIKVAAMAKISKASSHSKVAPQTKKEHYENKKVSFKDLCSEDKQRVANLINELARVGDEKNKVAEALNNEKVQFEQQMKDLLQEQERVLQERQGTHVAAVQQQFWECQNLLSRYQRIVSDQQDVLNQHVSEHEELQQKSLQDSSIENGLPNQLPAVHGRRQHSEQDPALHCHPTSQRQTTNVRPQDVPKLPVQSAAPPDDQGSQRSSTPLTELSNHSQLSDDLDTTPRGTRRVRVPSTASSDRPFTAYIDGLIANEQASSSLHKSLTHEGNRRGGIRVKAPSSSSSGPLHDPVLSSTRQSDTLSVSQQSRTKAGEFQPLLIDPSPRSSLQSTATHPLDDFSVNHHYQPHPQGGQYEATGHQYYNGAGAGAPMGLPHYPYPQGHGGSGPPGEFPPGSRVTFHEQLRQASPLGPHHPAHQLSEDDFVNYYRAMTPDERQRHLATQKSALLAEQERLRRILEDQEQLLHTKQHQLHLQQEEQRRRLQHFEQTGAFPEGNPPPVGSQKQVIRTVGHPEEPGLMLQPQSQMDYSLHTESSQDVPPHPHALGVDDPYRLRPVGENHAAHPHVGRLNTHIRSGIHVTNAQSSVDAESILPEVLDRVNPPEISQEELNAVTDSFENILFLQRHGIDVTDIKTKNSRNVHPSVGSPPMRTAGTSAGGVSPGGLPPSRASTTRQKVETMDDLLNSSRESSSYGVIDRNGKKMLRHTAKQRSSPQQISEAEHAARLLDLVDEVERNQHSHHHPAPHHNPSPGSTRFPRYESALEEAMSPTAEPVEDPDESRILEEVFFVM